MPDMMTLAVGVIGVLALGLTVVVSPKMLKWVIAIMMFPACAALAVDDFTKQVVNPTWLLPLQQYRSYVYLGLGILLAGGVLIHAGRLDRPRFGVQTVFVFMIGLYAAAIRVFHNGLSDGVQSALLVLITVPCIAFAISGSVRQWSDFHTVLRIVPGFALAYLFVLAVQFGINPRILTMGAESRFVGMTGNPQHAAAIFGPLVGLVIFSIINEPVKILKLAWMGTLVGCLICLLWTQSRTGALMAVMSTAGVFYQRIGAAILGLPVVALLGVVALQVAESLGISLGTQRFASTQDTRSAKWINMWETAMESPLIGRPFEEIAGSENSVLLGFANYGIVMLVLLVAFMLFSGFLMLKLLRVRGQMPRRYRPIVDAILGYNAAYFAGAMFEGYITSRIAANVLLIQIFAALTAKLLTMVKHEEQSGEFERLRMLEELGAEADGAGWSTIEELRYTSEYSRSDDV